MESTVEDKKQLGAYYTPERAARILADWAIRSPSDTVLEPSFGRCGFLQAVVDRLKARGCEDAIHNVHGYDIDLDAFEGPYESLVRENGAGNQFQKRDFLKVTPDDLEGRKNVIIGNPPYVSYHNMEEEQRIAAVQAVRESDFSLDRKASLWAYFVLHALAFLAEGGRVAWVLPGSFFHADYSSTIIDAVTEHFERAIALQLGERIFRDEGAEEHSVILLAEGWKTESPCEDLRVGYVPSLDDLEQTIQDWEDGNWTGNDYDSRIGVAFMAPRVSNAIRHVENECRVRRLGDVAEDVKIGIVTGDNRFFVIDRSEAQEHELEDRDWKYIFAKSKISDGISVTKQDFEDAYQSDERCLLVDGEGEVSEQLETYFDQKSKDEIESNVTFGKREDWRLPDDGNEPDAFFTYMQSLGPRLLLNQAGVNSTNTIHRVYFGNEIDGIERKTLAVSLLSTFSRLSAEVEGRTYGSGVLKLEIGETRQLQFVLPSDVEEKVIEEAYQAVDSHLRNEELDEAEERANEFVFRDIPQRKRSEIIQALKTGLRNARNRRRGT
jgi:adenine-specific DNA methylase